jgi:hypothetical protein
MKPVVGRYRATTQVNVLSPEIKLVEEVDSFNMLEGSMHTTVIGEVVCALRGLRQWHGIERSVPEPGRTYVLLRLRHITDMCE